MAVPAAKLAAIEGAGRDPQRTGWSPRADLLPPAAHRGQPGRQTGERAARLAPVHLAAGRDQGPAGCDEPQTRQEGDKTISYRVCRQTLPAGSEVQVVLKDTGYQYPVGAANGRPCRKQPSGRRAGCSNRPIVLASKEEQLDCRRADGRACSEPDLPGTELLDAEAAKIVQDASGQPAPVWQENYGHDDASCWPCPAASRACWRPISRPIRP